MTKGLKLRVLASSIRILSHRSAMIKMEEPAGVVSSGLASHRMGMQTQITTSAAHSMWQPLDLIGDAANRRFILL